MAVFVVLFGALLPVIALYIEWSYASCGDAFFDPIPTTWHIAAIGLVPVANLFALETITNKDQVSRGTAKLLAWMNGATLAISLIYAIPFLPLAPFGIIAIVFFGFGFLPLAPVLSFAAACVISKSLRSEQAEAIGGKWKFGIHQVAGALLAIVWLVIPEAQTHITNHYTMVATNGNESGRAHGLAMLRKVGSKQQLLERCYEDRTRRSLFGFGPRSRYISREDAQSAYFAVTGHSFNSVQPPRRVTNGSDFWRWNFDPDLGGDSVAGRIKDLSLAESEIKGEIFPGEAASYVEWTMVFNNGSNRQREARAQLLLPPNAVISRLTLWVNGEPREAAFSSNSKVKQAYKSIAVERRRDPVLVTWKGKDRIQMQCFPIPPLGDMKIRIGITTPLAGDELDSFRLPCIVERNFNINKEQIHDVWLESTNQLATANPDFEVTSEEPGFALSGFCSDTSLASNQSSVAVIGDLQPTVWTRLSGHSNEILVQEIGEQQDSSRRGVTLVIDGSAGMKDSVKSLVRLLDERESLDIDKVIIAGDEVVDLDALRQSRNANPGKLVRQQIGKGGCDNVAALAAAISHARKADAPHIVWVHGPQPATLTPAWRLARKLKNRGEITIHDVAVQAGTNRIVENEDVSAHFRSVARTGDLYEDLSVLIQKLSSPEKRMVRKWSLIPGDSRTEDELANKSRTEKIADLWANEKTLRMIRRDTRETPTRKKAAEFAAAMHVVTPVSGAVVLETREQYDEFGLTPVDEIGETFKVPASPEPGGFTLAFLAMLGLFGVARKKRSRAR